MGEIVVPKEYVTGADKNEVQDAVGTFLTTDSHALREAGPAVFAYYLDTARLVREQGWEVQLPVIAGPDSVWDYVTFGREFQVDHDSDVDRHVYISIECECAWEPEHGLQLVFRSGLTVSKVGPFDGHLSNVSAFGREDLGGTVYVSPFATGAFRSAANRALRRSRRLGSHLQCSDVCAPQNQQAVTEAGL